VALGANEEGVTNAEGRYRFSKLPRELSVLWLRVQKPGFVPLQVTWDNARAEFPVEIPREYTVKLEPGSTIGGVVEDEQGEPIAGVRVRVSIGSAGNHGRGEPRVDLDNFGTNTDANGRWLCDIAPGQLDSISIALEHEDYVEEPSRHRFRSQSPREFDELKALTAVIVLKKGLTLEGRVMNSDGNPIANAEVSLSRSFRRAASTSDEQGRFELNHVPPGRNRVAIRAKGYVAALKQVDAASGMAPLELRLEAGKTVSGRVLDEDNKPVAGAFIQLQIGASMQAIGRPVTSGQDGRFQIEGVPAAGCTFLVSRQFEMVSRRVVPSEKVELFVLAGPKPKMVHVTVTDADSGKPVPAFNVVLRGSMLGRHSATGGRYELTLSMPLSRPGIPPLEIRIEADGYSPSELRRVPTDRAEVDLKYELRKADGITGAVRAPDGSPAANAELGVRSLTDRIDIGDGRLNPNGLYDVVHSGRDGRFALPPREAPFVIVAAHPGGFAVRTIESRARQKTAPIELTLTAWGRVEGVFKIGSRPGSNQEISLFASGLIDAPKLQVIWRVSTPTDDNGRFVFERVLPTVVTIERTVQLDARHGLLVEDIPGFEVKPGRTVRLAVGGVGRPVIGRIAIPAELTSKWGRVQPSVRINFEVHPPKPYDQLNDEEQTRLGLEWRKTYRSYASRIQSDGSFRVEDVPTGTYELKIRLDEEFDEAQASGSFHGQRHLGGITRAITVPAIPGGLTRSDEPLDLGLLPLEIDRGPKVGDLAPDFQVTTLDTKKPLKLSDFRGNCVLIVFWISSSALNRPEFIGLKAVSSAFGNDFRFVMLGVNCDMQGDEAKSRAAEYGWSWLQTGPGVPSFWELRQKYNAYDLPSIWLVGPDGRVVAKDLKGAAIKEAVSQSVRSH
jgi:hypothetical protein